MAVHRMESGTSCLFMRILGLSLLALGTLHAAPSLTSPALPIRFEPNHGQVRTTAKEPVEWLARGVDYTYLFTRSSAILHFDQQSYKMRFADASPLTRIEGDGRGASITQYFTPALRGTVEGYRKLRRKDIYSGIDVVYYGNGNQLEYDFDVAPGADPSRIRFRFEGTGSVHLNANGDLVLGAGEQNLKQLAPVAYQLAQNGQRRPVASRYKLDDEGWISVALGSYDRSERLIIDPTLIYSTYLFGLRTDSAIAVGHDNQGFVYVAGNTQSTDFSVTSDVYDITFASQDAWFAKLNPKSTDGKDKLYITYFGGLGIETLRAMAVDPVTGKVYLTGLTTSTDLPIVGGYATANTATDNQGTDLFVSVFDPTLTGTAALTYSTYLGGVGTEEVRGIAVKDGKVYLAGSSAAATFPTVNAFFAAPAGGADMILSVLDTNITGASSLIFSTYLGGAGDDYARSIALDAAGLVYTAGSTTSTDLPISADAYQTLNKTGSDIFLFKIDVNARVVLYGTYLGGSNIDDVRRIVVEPAGRVAFTGYTLSQDFPVTQNAYQPLLNGTSNAFLTILDPSSAGVSGLAYSTFFGGGIADAAYDLARDIEGKYYLAGYTLSGRATSPYPLPVTNDALYQVSAAGGTDGFLAVIDVAAPPLNSLIYSTYITSGGVQTIYGVDVDRQNTAYLVGTATANLFPAGFSQKATRAGNIDGFFAAIQFPPPPQALLDELAAAEAEAAAARIPQTSTGEDQSGTAVGSESEAPTEAPVLSDEGSGTPNSQTQPIELGDADSAAAPDNSVAPQPATYETQHSGFEPWQ